ncbi:PREDICTED: uncharacterized protein LOC109153951 [Ipomoea nil]|uniref:uncharacterized protein LOC109153951 n=1 Tax=Ipomoea nil TaxID=35883 RepID=UPI000901673F|nr:PREDICTED: uncharacterized protein LOC109153951 [Ipomoea nil]
MMATGKAWINAHRTRGSREGSPGLAPYASLEHFKSNSRSLLCTQEGGRSMFSINVVVVAGHLVFLSWLLELMTRVPNCIRCLMNSISLANDEAACGFHIFS